MILFSSSSFALLPSLSLVFSTSFIATKASSAFIYFYAFRSISAIIFEGFFTSKTTKSLDFNPALKVVNYTLSSTSSTSNVSWVKRFTYNLRVFFSPYLMVSKWSTGLLRHCPLTKWRKKELPNYSKLSMDDVGNFINHSHAAPLKVVGNERHNISSGGYWRPRVFLKVLRWSKRSFNPSNDSSWDKRNFDGTGHSRTAAVKGESVVLTILSRLQSVSRRRSKFGPSRVAGLWWSFLQWLSPSSS